MTTFEPQIVAFTCSNCASAAAQVADDMGLQLPANIRAVQIPCTGRLDTLHMLKAIEHGADGVYVAGCQEDSCQYRQGIEKARKKVNLVKEMLEQLGVEPERVEIFQLSAGKGQAFVEVARQMTEKIKELGPSPLR
ncbi:MAG: hydrogenase iron-sulfur subunit [Deltaproteobacteria bacterium]|nr:hydrogenase iron-sulfur subunit [Deltaproteobacteria bacterium]MBW2071360.1 hydrogenase iron-sulfur subunit [Deltaproteobacteria bacterium]